MEGRHSCAPRCGRMRIARNSCTVNWNSDDGRKVGLRGRAPLVGRMWHGAGCAATGEVRVWWCSRTPGPSACFPWSGSSRAPHRTEPYDIPPTAYPAKVLRICGDPRWSSLPAQIRENSTFPCATVRPRGVSKLAQRGTPLSMHARPCV